MNSFRSSFLRLLIPLLLLGMGAALGYWLIPGEIAAVKLQLIGFPDSDVAAHELRPWVLGGLCLLPALAALVYCGGSILDRYIARQFIGTFALCLAGLTMIWLLLDLSDKMTNFRESKNVLATMFEFYTSRSPAVMLLLLPYSLLLSLLYSLGKLSSNREIIAMVQAGRSVIRITIPLFIAGFFFSLTSLGLSYHWGPIAEGTVDDILAEATGKLATEATNVLYRDPEENRLWMIGAFPRDYQMGKPLIDIEVTTTRSDKTLESRLTAKRAWWDRDSHQWTFDEAEVGYFTPNQPAIYETPDNGVMKSSWPETPWQLIKPGLSAAYLGIPDLNTWIGENRTNHRFADPSPYLTHWHCRWALPFACIITVLLATPLALHFARRGPGGGTFMAVVLSALLMFFTNISTALGESGTLTPMLAAWLPNLAFGLLGLYLFRRRVTGRPIYLVLRRLFPAND